MPIAHVNGVDIYHEVSGPKHAPVLVQIMGFGTQMVSWPEDFSDYLLEAGFRLVRFDNRDVGLSQKFDGILPDMKAVAEATAKGQKPPAPYVLADMADDVAALLHHLDIGQAHIAGSSMGGMIAQLVALRHPQITRSLISIMSTTSDPALPRATPEAQSALMSRPASNAKEDVVALGVKNRGIISGRLFDEDETSLRARISRVYDRSFYPEGTLRQWAAILGTPPRTEALKGLKCPTLVIHGNDDNLILPRAGRHTADCIPGSRYVEIDGWGHYMSPASVPVVADPMIRFVREVEAGSFGRAA
jgi:pimeloyl-ACP methyl ester carboxylesterase